MKSIPLALVLAAAALGISGHALAAPPTAAMLSEACGGCHGTRGASAGLAIPSLAGQTKEYFVASMKQYRSGQRPSTVMGRLAHGYTDAQIESMAGYFAAQKPVAQSAPLDPALVKKGMAVYYKQCKYCHLDGALWRQIHQYREFEQDCSKSCHLDYGPEKGENLPNIGGQWFEYLTIQMKDFKSGARKMSPRKAKALKVLSPADMEAVAAFYASQKDLAR